MGVGASPGPKEAQVCAHPISGQSQTLKAVSPLTYKGSGVEIDSRTCESSNLKCIPPIPLLTNVALCLPAGAARRPSLIFDDSPLPAPPPALRFPQYGVPREEALLGGGPLFTGYPKQGGEDAGMGVGGGSIGAGVGYSVRSGVESGERGVYVSRAGQRGDQAGSGVPLGGMVPGRGAGVGLHSTLPSTSPSPTTGLEAHAGGLDHRVAGREQVPYSTSSDVRMARGSNGVWPGLEVGSGVGVGTACGPTAHDASHDASRGAAFAGAKVSQGIGVGMGAHASTWNASTFLQRQPPSGSVARVEADAMGSSALGGRNQRW